jgi:hypothetical protein
MRSVGLHRTSGREKEGKDGIGVLKGNVLSTNSFALFVQSIISSAYTNIFVFCF